MKYLFLILLLNSVALFNACEPGGDLVVVNDRSEQVQIYLYDFLGYDNEFGGPYPYGIVPSRTRKMVGVVIYTSLDKKYRIEAKTASGDIVFSRILTAQELIDMNWTIIIPPE